MHVVPLVLNQWNSGFLSSLIYSDTTALNYRMVLSTYMSPWHIFLVCSLCWWKHMLRYPAESVESNIWCSCYTHIDPGIAIQEIFYFLLEIIVFPTFVTFAWYTVTFSLFFGKKLTFNFAMHSMLCAESNVFLFMFMNTMSSNHLSLTWGVCHLQSLLCDPNPNSPANSEAARMFSENKREYNRKVREVVEQSWTADWCIALCCAAQLLTAPCIHPFHAPQKMARCLCL